MNSFPEVPPTRHDAGRDKWFPPGHDSTNAAPARGGEDRVPLQQRRDQPRPSARSTSSRSPNQYQLGTGGGSSFRQAQINSSASARPPTSKIPPPHPASSSHAASPHPMSRTTSSHTASSHAPAAPHDGADMMPLPASASSQTPTIPTIENLVWPPGIAMREKIRTTGKGVGRVDRYWKVDGAGKEFKSLIKLRTYLAEHRPDLNEKLHSLNPALSSSSANKGGTAGGSCSSGARGTGGG